MKKIAKRSICLLLAFVCLMSCCAITAFAASPVTGVASDQWKQALDSSKSKTSYYSPYMAASNSEEFYSKIGTGHLQGMCVDDDLRYMYVSYTNGIGKIDMATGEVAGYLTGFDGGLHIGCLAYYDGHIYGSFEAQATHKFYIIQIDESQFWGVMDTREKWLDAVRVILLYEPTVDARDLMGDTPVDTDGIAGRNKEEGHRYSNAGIDGVTFGTYPGEFGKEDADVYMFVSYGTYWWGDGSGSQKYRLDDEHIILQAYNTNDFLNEQNQSQYLLELAYTDNKTPDQNGVSNARSLYYADDSILHAEKALFVFVGNTRWGCQQIEYDRTTGDIWLSTYGASDGSPVAGANWHVIDGSKTPQHKEIQLGQNADLTRAYGYLKDLDAEKQNEIVTAAKERATRYGDNETVENSTWDTWEYKPQGGFSENGYPVGDIPYLKCVCGNCKNGLDGKGDYIGYTKANGYDVERMICCGVDQYMCMGLVSLGNGYWYWDGAGSTQDCLKLFHMDGFDATTGAVGKATNITDANIVDYVEKETAAGTMTSTVEDAKKTLQTRVTKTEQNYPTNAAGYSDASWTALQNALSGAEAVLADSSATAEQADAAMETLKTALKGMRKTAEFEAAATESDRMSSKLYGQTAINEYRAKADAAKTGSEAYSQTKLDTLTAELNTLRASMTPDINKDFEETRQAIETDKDVDLADSGWELLQTTIPTDQTAKITADGKVIRSLSAGTYTVPIANVASMRIDGTADASVCRYKDLRTIAGITVNGTALYGFDRETYAYTVKIPTTTETIPTVAATPVDGCEATVEVTQATEAEGTATIVVTRADGSTVTYTVTFIKDSSQDDVVTPVPETEIYASDLDTVWVTTYPNRRGLDSKNERFMRDKGWTNPDRQSAPNYGEDVKLEGVDAQGSRKSYAKGFTLHGITSYNLNNDEAEIGKTDAEIKKGYTDANDLIKYSSVRFDVRDYTKFTTTLSTAWAQYSGSQNTSLTVNIYCDNVLKESYKLHCKNNSINEVGHDVSIDLTGVSYLTIQVDPENVDNVGKDGDWANGDIVTFGDAKFYRAAVVTEEVYLSDLPDTAHSTVKRVSDDTNGKGTPTIAVTDSPSGVHYMNKNSGYSEIYGYNSTSEKLTFSKRLVIEPLVSAQVGNIYGKTKDEAMAQKTEETYRQTFVNGDNGKKFSDYSSVTFNIEGMGYKTFQTTFGPRFNTSSQTDVNVIFYVDGVEQFRKNVHTKDLATDVAIDLTGAKTFTIQLDPKGVGDTQAATKMDYAWGDIIVFGNAKFIKEKPQQPTVTKPQDKNIYLSDLADSEHTAAKKVSDQGDGNGTPTIAVREAASGIHYMNKNSGSNNTIWGYSHVDDNSPKEDVISFEKRLEMEPMVAAQVGNIYGKALDAAKGTLEMEYRQTFVDGNDGKKFEDYSSVTWYIENEGYDVFRCTFGPRGGNTWSATDVTVNMYVDGVLRFTKNVRRWTGATDVEIDLTGAKTFTIQLDPLGDGTKTDDLAAGDILVFGDARFVKLTNRLTHTHTPASEWTQGENGHWHACSGCAEHLGYAAHTLSGEPTEQMPQTCTVCGKIIKEQLKHAPIRTAAVEPTCTTSGNIEYFYCPNCNKYYKDEKCTQEIGGPDEAFLPANGHSMHHVGRVEPTYNHAGNIEYWYCTVCRKNFADEQGTQELTGSTILPKKAVSGLIQAILPLLDKQFPFTDVSVNSWYYASVRSAWENDLINGVSAYKFEPDGQLTVAQAIKLAAALHQMQTSGSVTLKNGQPWYSTYLSYAVRNGIVGEPYMAYTAAQMSAPVTRGEFVHILCGAAKDHTVRNEVADNAIPDVKVTDAYCADIYTFYRAGILTGSDAKGTFHADSTIRRSEVSAILNRMYDVSARQSITLK